MYKKQVLGFVVVFLSTLLCQVKGSEIKYDAPAGNASTAIPVLCGNIVVLQHGGVKNEELELFYKDSSRRASYQNLGSVKLVFGGHEAYTHYARGLNMDNGVASVSYKMATVTYKRELLADYVNHVIVLRITASKKQSISFVETHECTTGFPFVKIWNEGGVLEANKVTNADAVTIVIGDLSDSLSLASGIFPYEQLRRKHVKAYSREFEKPRFKLYGKAVDKQVVLNFEFSRYQNISRFLSTNDSSYLETGESDEPQLVSLDKPLLFPTDFGINYSKIILCKLVDSSNGLIDILPDLPQEWAAGGEIVGVTTPGGFTIEMVWKKGKIKTLVVRSKLGGNCRIKVPNDIEGCKCIGMQPAMGKNTNSYFSGDEPDSVVAVKPVHSDFTYDFETGPGQVYVLTGK
ncbi:MAG: glycoside hydrolase N-terminal domain-containing protein [Paludibacteraceae bacterium]|nr:glycoside hydrolase N-terminal domain-containing protein [Paludibacteraceae bacterium]